MCTTVACNALACAIILFSYLGCLQGLSWSKPSFIVGAGSADPSLLRVGGSLVMSGGRNCNNINKTIGGCRRGADLMMWLSVSPHPRNLAELSRAPS